MREAILIKELTHRVQGALIRPPAEVLDDFPVGLAWRALLGGRATGHRVGRRAGRPGLPARASPRAVTRGRAHGHRLVSQGRATARRAWRYRGGTARGAERYVLEINTFITIQYYQDIDKYNNEKRTYYNCFVIYLTG